MLKTLLTPLTTPTAGGTSFRDVLLMLITIIGVFSALGWLSEEQAEALKEAVNAIIGNWAAIVTVVSTLSGVALMIYRALFLSRSTGADAVAKAIDNSPTAKEAAKEAMAVQVITPTGSDNATVPVPEVK